MGMGVTVPDRVICRVIQPEISTEINNPLTKGEQFSAVLHRLPVWQSNAQHVAGLQFRHRRKFEIGHFSEVRMRPPHRFPRKPLGGDLLYFHLRMKQKQPQQLAAAIPGGADDRNGNHDWATFTRWSIIRSGISTPVGCILLRNSMV